MKNFYWWHDLLALNFEILIYIIHMYRTLAIITRSWFETALDYNPRILGQTFLVYVLKWYVILPSLALKNGVKSIQTARYNVAHTVLCFSKCSLVFVGPCYVNSSVLDRRPKVYGRSRRFRTYGYGYGGRSFRLFLRPKVLFVIFLLFSKIEAEMCFLLDRCHLRLD